MIYMYNMHTKYKDAVKMTLFLRFLLYYCQNMSMLYHYNIVNSLQDLFTIEYMTLQVTTQRNKASIPFHCF